MPKCLAPLSLAPLAKGQGRNITPCGKCEACLQTRRQDWTFRLSEEYRHAKTGHFVTLTYAEGNEPYTPEGYNELSKAHIQTFMKKLRKHADYARKVLKWPPIRFYAAGEYGTMTDRPHYHIILFNVPPDTINEIESIWGLGFVQLSILNHARIHYTTKYIIQPKAQSDEQEKRQPQFALMSRRPGLGSQYIHRAKKWHTDNLYPYVINEYGAKQSMPRYYKDKIFSASEREQIKDETLQNSLKVDRKFIESTPYYFEVEQTRREAYIQKVKQSSKTKQL